MFGFAQRADEIPYSSIVGSNSLELVDHVFEDEVEPRLLLALKLVVPVGYRQRVLYERQDCDLVIQTADVLSSTTEIPVDLLSPRLSG